MQVISINIGKIREATWKGKTFNTAIFKEPVAERIHLGTLGLTGDEQANTENHGGRLKALFAYPYEHYTEYWRDALGAGQLPYGSFGENLTTQGWVDDQIYVGDKYRIGTALVAVTIPRKPCFKLNTRLGRDDVLAKYMASKRTGFYDPIRGLVEDQECLLAKFVKEKLSDLGAKIKVRQIVEIGVPYKSIVEKAEEEGVDMIIMSTHGRSGFDHMLIGGVTEKVVRRATCPVLSIRPAVIK